MGVSWVRSKRWPPSVEMARPVKARNLALATRWKADIEHVQAARRIDDIPQDHAVVVEAAVPTYVEYRFGTDAHDARRIVCPHVDVADTTDAIGITKTRVDAMSSSSMRYGVGVSAE
jgi:hypothetical protein